MRGHAPIKCDGRLEEINDILVLDVLRPIARNVKGRVAGCVLGELVAPKVWVRLGLGNPVPWGKKGGGDVSEWQNKENQS